MKTKMHGLWAFVLAVGALPVLAQETPMAPPPPGQQQGPGGPGEHHDPAQREAKQIEMLTKRLKLTPDQVTQVQAIGDAERTQAMALRHDTSLQPEDKHARMLSMRQDTEGKIRGVLTEEQKPKYDALLTREREHRGHRPDGPGAPPAPPAGPTQ